MDLILLDLTQLHGFNSVADVAAGITLTYITTVSSTVNGTSFNFGNVTVPENGLLIACVTGALGGTAGVVTSVSLGGTNGTIHINPSGSSAPTCIASRQVSSGANNVTVVFDTSKINASCSLFLLTGNLSDTPTDTDGINTGTNSTSRINTLDLPANSVAVYCVVHEDSSNTTWSAATERSDAVLEANAHAAASKTTVSQLIGNTETTSWTGSVDNGSSAACWN